MYVDKCTLYASFRERNDSVHHVDISVEGRKSLCLAVAPQLIRFVDEHCSQHPVSFELQTAGADENWVTEAHRFQV